MRMRLEYPRLLIEATRLDVFDLAYEFSSEAYGILSLEGSADLPRKGIATRVGIFLWHFCQGFLDFGRRKAPDIPAQPIIFWALSKNEVDSLRPVYLRTPDACLAGSHSVANHPFPMFWAYALSCAYLPLVVINFLKSRGYRRKSFEYVFDHYWLIYGLFVVTRMWLDRLKPKALVLTNHTYTYHRVLQKAAYDEGIPTFYLQHASIPENVPPLTSDYALLEGHDALKKLACAGTTRPQSFLIGMPKHDAHFRHINSQAQVRSIGLCTSGWDPLPRAEQLLARIRQEFPTLPIILRPHNADRRVKEWQDLARRYGLEFSVFETEHPFDYLKRVDAIIAGDSNILLEAALMNVLPAYYDFAQTRLDWYGFQRNGLVEYFSEPSEVCRYIREISESKPSVRMKASRYCATIGTRYDGHSSELASTLIQELVSGNEASLKGWKRIPSVGLEAYELDDGDAVTALE